mmetsp:Transcript_74606/g.242322  ORF Transcript_74606/g.242322 Transcript_74606/m.242322 type:complete len:231 (+) Transcript_74606:7-699(+)
MGRVSAAFVLLWVNIALQGALLYYTRVFVAEKREFSIRTDYDNYEAHMYGGDDSHFVFTPNGFRRGLPEFFQPALFASLDESVKEGACSIPLSQPLFLALVLFIWTLMCLGELRRCGELFHCLTLSTPRLGDAFVQLALTTQDLVYHTMVSAADKREVELTRIELGPAHRRESTSLWLCLRSFLWGIAALVFVYTYISYWQSVLPEYRWDVHTVCRQWLETRFQPHYVHV